MGYSKIAIKLMKDATDNGYLDYGYLEFLYENGKITEQERQAILTPKKIRCGGRRVNPKHNK